MKLVQVRYVDVAEHRAIEEHEILGQTRVECVIWGYEFGEKDDCLYLINEWHDDLRHEINVIPKGCIIRRDELCKSTTSKKEKSMRT